MTDFVSTSRYADDANDIANKDNAIMGASISVMYLYALFMSGNSFIKMGRGFAALQSSIINSIEMHQERNEKRTIPSMKHVIVFFILTCGYSLI